MLIVGSEPVCTSSTAFPLESKKTVDVDTTFGSAYVKSQIAAGQHLPKKGNVFISVKNQDKRAIVFIAKKLVDLGFNIMATSGTADVLMRNDLEVEIIPKPEDWLNLPNLVIMLDRKTWKVYSGNSRSKPVVSNTDIRISNHIVLSRQGI